MQSSLAFSKSVFASSSDDDDAVSKIYAQQITQSKSLGLAFDQSYVVDSEAVFHRCVAVEQVKNNLWIKAGFEFDDQL